MIQTGVPRTHLLSNGRYSVMITDAGSGYSRWHDLAITRWREDTTCDTDGAYVFLRDVSADDVWSVGYQPYAGSLTREIELTSYAEVVLASPAVDAAHPAFSNLFVRTEYVSAHDTLLTTRRPRAPTEPPLWMGHVLVVKGETVGALEWETDRARFLGRGRTIRPASRWCSGITRPPTRSSSTIRMAHAG